MSEHDEHGRHVASQSKGLLGGRRDCLNGLRRNLSFGTLSASLVAVKFFKQAMGVVFAEHGKQLAGRDLQPI
jgi:hypothetical protein